MSQPQIARRRPLALVGARLPRAWLCAKIGAGDQDRAIRDLLTFYANSKVELPYELAGPIRAWIRG
jgi:hypothetical protein